ncbi:MAG: 3-hydroxyisobutyrate dehydrogenase [Oleiphilaceae bacterium]|nr:3-hydroxyisobutyrate dehydrogenase [Oleiphilaceae bacterium]
MAAIAFIGLGNMGGPMATNLIKAGHQVCVFDLVPELVSRLVEAGATTAPSAKEASLNADAVITMLPAGKHVAGIYLGHEGLLAQLNQRTLVIDCSTIDAETAREVHKAAEALSIDMLDAPVSGGVAAATAGTLTFMCGGPDQAFERARAILSDMGANIFHAGPSGAGQVAKMCNNMLLAIHMIGTGEALKLGEKNGLDAKVLSEIMLASSGKNWSLEKYNPYPGVMPQAPASNQYQPGFMVDLMTKDLGLAIDNAQANAAKTPLGAMALQLYLEKQAHGDGKRDFSSIIEALE